DPPNERWYRWQDRPYFVEHCKRFGVQEMDFGFCDLEGRILHLLELKDYSRPGELPPALVDELVQKATDCLLLLGSIWHGLPHAEGLKRDLHEEWHQKPVHAGGLRLIFVVKLAEQSHRADMQPMLDKLRNKLAGRLELFALRQIATVELLDHW